MFEQYHKPVAVGIVAGIISFAVWFGVVDSLNVPDNGRIKTPAGVNQHIAKVAGPMPRVCPANVYPDPLKTPGSYETLDLNVLLAKYDGQTYSQSHRSVTTAFKEQIYASYGIKTHKTGQYEIDHFWVECGGAKQDATNLWPQPAVNDCNGVNMGFHEKDKLEAFICRQIKAKQIDPKVAFDKLTTDWVAFYHEVIE